MLAFFGKFPGFWRKGSACQNHGAGDVAGHRCRSLLNLGPKISMPP